MFNLKAIDLSKKYPHLSIESLIWSLGQKYSWKLTPAEYSERIFLADLMRFKEIGIRLINVNYLMTSDGLIVDGAEFERVPFLKSIYNNANAFITLDQQKVLNDINLGLSAYTRESWDKIFHDFFYNHYEKPILTSHHKFRLASNTRKNIVYTVEEGLADFFKDLFLSQPINYLFNFFKY